MINRDPVLHAAVLEAGKYLVYLLVCCDLFVLKIPKASILERTHESKVHVTRGQCRGSGGTQIGLDSSEFQLVGHSGLYMQNIGG